MPRPKSPIARSNNYGSIRCERTFAATWAHRLMAKSAAPELVTLNSDQLEELLTNLASVLPAETYPLIQKLLRTLQWLMSALEAKDTTIGRLARMIFGAKTEVRPGCGLAQPALDH